jgi:hypothetical protein
MRWAVGLLDPAAQPALSNLITAGEVAAEFEGRPYSYDEPEVLKVIILMTDGANTNQYDIIQSRRSGPSEVYRDPNTGRTSTWVERYGEYYWQSDGQRHPGPEGGADAVPILWPELWGDFTARRIADRYYYGIGDNALRNSVRYNSIERYAGSYQADLNLRTICDAANSAGIIIFTIAFEAPQGGRDVMQYCATTPAHYYDAAGIEISEAFASIAQSINQLRLIQ